MINSVGLSTQNFGTATISTFKKLSDGNMNKILKSENLINDPCKEKSLKAILEAYLPFAKSGEISNNISTKISEAFKLLTGVDMNPDRFSKKILSKVNDNKYIFGNETIANNGAKSIIEFIA